MLLDKEVKAHDVHDVSLAVPISLLELTSFSVDIKTTMKDRHGTQTFPTHVDGELRLFRDCFQFLQKDMNRFECLRMYADCCFVRVQDVDYLLSNVEFRIDGRLRCDG
jgi:hypothetical protein